MYGFVIIGYLCTTIDHFVGNLKNISKNFGENIDNSLSKVYSFALIKIICQTEE